MANLNKWALGIVSHFCAESESPNESVIAQNRGKPKGTRDKNMGNSRYQYYTLILYNLQPTT